MLSFNLQIKLIWKNYGTKKQAKRPCNRETKRGEEASNRSEA